MAYRNKELMYARQEQHRQDNKKRLWDLLLTLQCNDCKMDDPRVLQFDHLPAFEKKFEIARAVAGSTRSWKTILGEMEKCEVVCANCHLIRTQARGGWSRFTMYDAMPS